MANYTETLGEYLDNGGTLPPEFDTLKIDEKTTFTEIFTAYYYMHELGLEDEAAFCNCLNYYAKIYIPILSIELEKEKILLTNVESNKQTSSGNSSSKNENFDNPINGVIGSTSEQSTSTGAGNSQSETKQEGGQTSLTILMGLQAYSRPILRQLLDVFAPCFMEVY